MGTQISVQNRTNNGIYVEVWTKGRGFKVGSWGVAPWKEEHQKFQAVWYDLCVISNNNVYWKGIYGGNLGGTNLYFDGKVLEPR